MSEQRPPYQAGPPAPTYRVKLSYHLTYPGEQAIVTQADELRIEARDATEAAMLAVAQLERLKPKRATITGLRMTVTLDL